MDVALAVRARRTTLGLSLSALSERSGVSKAMLSDVERGAKSPTLKTLTHIASGLGCSVSDLLDEAAQANSELISQDARPSVRDPESGALRQLLSTGLLHHGVEVIHYDLPPAARLGPFPSNGPVALELIVLLNGRVEVVVDGESTRMQSGDSLTYRISRELVLENKGSKDARLIIVIDRSRASRPLTTRLSERNEHVA